mmetsp:Transcript_25199/g.63994  ORF Transcript_25199/g.63994 Transcript_25199/m.63994 type:complete len:216 (-) Transcript_25199:95-742(-)
MSSRQVRAASSRCQRLRTALSVRPGSDMDMSDHLKPCNSTPSQITLSSEEVHGTVFEPRSALFSALRQSAELRAWWRLDGATASSDVWSSYTELSNICARARWSAEPRSAKLSVAASETSESSVSTTSSAYRYFLYTGERMSWNGSKSVAAVEPAPRGLRSARLPPKPVWEAASSCSDCRLGGAEVVRRCCLAVVAGMSCSRLTQPSGSSRRSEA